RRGLSLYAPFPAFVPIRRLGAGLAPLCLVTALIRAALLRRLRAVRRHLARGPIAHASPPALGDGAACCPIVGPRSTRTGCCPIRTKSPLVISVSSRNAT